MAEDKPAIHVDSDWKRQAQEEKKRLAEEEAKRKQNAAASQPAAAAGQRGRQARQMPPASFATLVQSMLTQVLFYLGELETRDSEGMMNLDMARHQIDMMGMLEEKTRGNLTPEEKQVLDTALYEARMRFVNLASQLASYP
jgi:hypothetical protein